MAAEAGKCIFLTHVDMKRILVLSLSLICMLPLFAQQKLSVFGIAEKWDKSKEYSFDNAGRGPLFGEMVKSFAREYDANPMMHALLTRLSGGPEDAAVSEFTLDGKNNYVRLRLEADELAETEARFWPLPGDKGWFVIKMINLDEDTLPRIYFLRVDTAKGVMKPAREPEGMNYGMSDNFIIPRTGGSIEVFNEYLPSDHIVLADGIFVYQSSAPVSIYCYVNDPDPSGITNVRDKPSGKVIVRLGGEPELSPEEEEYEDWPEFESYEFTLHHPTNGWWQIHAKEIQGVEIAGEAWIHYSVLEMRTRNYGGQSLKLYQKPSADAPVVAVIKTEEAAVRPMDLSPDGEWTKVKAKAGTGWIETSWLCGNPYTTCP